MQMSRSIVRRSIVRRSMVRPSVSQRRSLIAATAAVTLAVSGLVSATAAHAATGSTARVVIAGTRPSWAVTHGPKAAPAVKTGSVDARIYLAGRDEAGLTAYATEVSTPSDAMYHHYLKPAQLRARFGATQSQVEAIESWVRASGLKVTAVDSEIAGYVEVEGSVAQATRAFGVSFGSFEGPDGHMYRAPESNATAPASVARFDPHDKWARHRDLTWPSRCSLRHPRTTGSPDLALRTTARRPLRTNRLPMAASSHGMSVATPRRRYVRRTG